MSLTDMLREALRALGANRARSALTILGIVIGISAVIAMTSLIGGVQDSLVGSLGLNAARMVNVNGTRGFRPGDVSKLARELPDYERLAGVLHGGAQVERDGSSVYVNVTGGTADYFDITGQGKLVSGRMFTQAEEDSGARVLLITRDGARILFGSPDADVAGKSVELSGRTYQVVGVVDDGFSNQGGSDYFSAYTTLETTLRYFAFGQERLDSVVGLAREGVDVEELAERTSAAVGELYGLEGDEVEENVWVSTMKASIDQMNAFMGSFALIIGSVAGISLLVGGIGIMNMMLTNVTERIREIGVRRALGARRRDITLQFLVESAALCLVGGIVGMVVGYAMSWGLAAVASAMNVASSLGVAEGARIVPAFSLSTASFAVGTSIAIGLVFGYYPARRASRLDPVECLRYQ